MASKKISLNVDSKLWYDFRLKAFKEQKTATSVLEEYMREYVKGKK